ncbi:AAA family ATPase [Flavobacterium sp. SM15]|uniref:shikimate kinase n=1 Tax=Flavobacterium sp. SM15 TaxID=2908005 RepID=UPI001EDA8652|nr:shikimate kinase [Flavobacterium sp. SM15]MCG2610459.1 AAA family ATPase [Flavobacterium sp. SM15]
MKKIILVGYMGSGKTTIGKLLAEKTEIPFFDLDAIIEKNTQKTISQLFTDEGEIKFRKLEHQTLKTFLEKHETFVLSLGGGTPCYANNHEVLLPGNVFSFYLKASIKKIVERVASEKKHRPLLANKSDAELEDFIAKHLFERSYFYHQAKVVIDVDDKSPQVITEEIITSLT